MFYLHWYSASRYLCFTLLPWATAVRFPQARYFQGGFWKQPLRVPSLPQRLPLITASGYIPIREIRGVPDVWTSSTSSRIWDLTSLPGLRCTTSPIRRVVGALMRSEEHTSEL